MLIDNLDNMMFDMDFSEEIDSAEDGSPAEGKSFGSLSASAHFLLRRLRETGWVDVEYQREKKEVWLRKFRQKTIMPDCL